MEDNATSQADKKAQNQQQLNRNTIKRIKKTLVMQDAQYEGLRAKFLGQQANSQQASHSPTNNRKPRKGKDDLAQIWNVDVDDVGNDIGLSDAANSANFGANS